MKFLNQDRTYDARQFRDEEGGAGSGDGEGSEGGAGKTDEGTAALVELQGKMDTIQAENDRLNAKVSAANKHQKESEKKARQADREKAEASNDYEQLFKSSEQERTGLQEQLDSLNANIQAKDVKAAAAAIAAELADGPNQTILARFVADRLKYAEDGVKVTDSAGNLTVSTLDDLRDEFKGSAQFSSLIKGNQSSGGGATGGSSSGGAVKEMTRSDFDALDPSAQMKFNKSGGKLVQR